MSKTQMIGTAVLGFVLMGGGFAAGMTVGKNAPGGASASASAPAGFGGAFPGAPGGPGNAVPGANAQQLVVGRVLSVNEGSITVELTQPAQQGASPTITTQLVLVGSSTRVARSTETEIKAGDLKANDQVQIVGQTDSSGRVTATAIIVGGSTILPGVGGSGGPPSATPSPTR